MHRLRMKYVGGIYVIFQNGELYKEKHVLIVKVTRSLFYLRNMIKCNRSKNENVITWPCFCRN